MESCATTKKLKRDVTDFAFRINRRDNFGFIVDGRTSNVTGRLNRTGGFWIESYGNGFAYQIVRKADGATVFLQGDDAISLGQELDRTTDRLTDEDVVSQYFV